MLSDPAEVAATPHRDAFDATMSSSGSLSSKVSRTNSPAAVSTGVGTEDVAPSGEESLSFFKRLLSRLGGSPKASLSPTSNMGSQGGSPGDVMRTQSSRSYGAMSPSSPHTHRQSRRSHREPSHFPSQLSTALTAAARESPDDRAKRLLKRFQGVVPQEVLVVDLDCNAVSPLSSTLDMQLPPRLLLRYMLCIAVSNSPSVPHLVCAFPSRIFEAIIRHGNVYSVLHPEYEQPHPDLPRSMTPLERQRWELSFNQVRDRMQEQLTAARARVQAATFAAVGGSATKSLTPTGQSTKGGFGSPGTPDSTHSGRGSTTNSPSGNATPMQFQAPATLNILNSDDERSDPMAGKMFTVGLCAHGLTSHCVCVFFRFGLQCDGRIFSLGAPRHSKSTHSRAIYRPNSVEWRRLVRGRS